MTYDAALSKCQEIGAGLVEMKTEKELQEVRTLT